MFPKKKKVDNKCLVKKKVDNKCFAPKMMLWLWFVPNTAVEC